MTAPGIVCPRCPKDPPGSADFSPLWWHGVGTHLHGASGSRQGPYRSAEQAAD